MAQHPTRLRLHVKRNYTKKQRAADEQNWKKRHGNNRGSAIRETVRIYNTGYRPAPRKPWRYADDSGGTCAECKKTILTGDMLMPAVKGQRKKHYHCVLACYGGGKHL